MPVKDPVPTVVVSDVGATFVRVALARGATLGPVVGRPIADLRRAGDDGIVPAIAEIMAEVVAAGRRDVETAGMGPVAVGIGVCAAVDDDGSIQRALSFGIPAGRRMASIVEEALGLPVAIDNDANMAAFGELHHGAGRGLRDFLLVTLGTNIGMGIVVGGQVCRGVRGGAGEAGMMLVPVRTLSEATGGDGRRRVDAGRLGSSASRAPDGYAWIEELVGGGALAAAWRRESGDAGSMTDSPTRVLHRAAAGDPTARMIVERAIEGWAFAIANYVALLEPGAIVLAGGVADDLGPFLESLRARAAALSRVKPTILMAELGSVGGLIGAGAAAQATARATV